MRKASQLLGHPGQGSVGGHGRQMEAKGIWTAGLGSLWGYGWEVEWGGCTDSQENKGQRVLAGQGAL